ncbi:hypothetical protein GN956_G25500 [Arapaima gigas]
MIFFPPFWSALYRKSSHIPACGRGHWAYISKSCGLICPHLLVPTERGKRTSEGQGKNPLMKRELHLENKRAPRWQ